MNKTVATMTLREKMEKGRLRKKYILGLEPVDIGGNPVTDGKIIHVRTKKVQYDEMEIGREYRFSMYSTDEGRTWRFYRYPSR